MFKSILHLLINRKSLTQTESYEAMQMILEGKATPAQMSSFVTLLSFRGIETDELIGLTKAMRDYAAEVTLNINEPLVDTCGTGGAAIKTFNVSTASALVASSSGLNIAKHGNRSVTSSTGSADVLEELGLDVHITGEKVEEVLNRDHMCFMFAPIYHQAMKHVALTRKEIGFRSVFNLLGPLSNPAGTTRQVIGVFDRQYSLTMAETLQALGSEHVLIVNADDGLDEFSIAAATQVTELKHGTIKQYRLTPEDVGLTRHALDDLQARYPQQSAALIVSVLNGDNRGAAYEMVAMNAGAALYVGQKASSIAQGITLAKELIDSGQAWQHYQGMTQNREAVKHA